jgi:hypothetical protein
MTVVASTSSRINEEFLLLLFFHANWEASILTGELPEESAQFRFIRVSCLVNLKCSIESMKVKPSTVRVDIPLDLSTRSFIPFPRFIHTRTTTSLLTPSIVLLNQSST